MKRNFYRTPVDGVNYRYRVTFESDPAPVGTPDYRVVQRALLQSLLDNPGLLDCGMNPFQTLKMTHNGETWTVEIEAVGP